MFGESFKKMRKSKGLTQDDLAKAVGVTRQSVQKWESDSSKPSFDKWGSIENALGVDKAWILEISGNDLSHAFSDIFTDYQLPNTPPNTSPHHEPHQTIKIPLISWVQAGDWQYAADPMPPGVADEWIETSATRSEHAYALTVHGDSMEPEFASGDIITVDPERQAENGSYVVVKNGAEATFKQYVKNGAEATFKQYVMDGPSVFLKPLNNRYPIKDMTGVDFRIVGVVVEKRKRY